MENFLESSMENIHLLTNPLFTPTPPQCQIYESGLSETLSMMVDSAGTWVVGVGLIPPVTVCQGEEPEAIPANHNTTVIIRSPTPAPVLVSGLLSSLERVLLVT